jgi:hypothetical protein
MDEPLKLKRCMSLIHAMLHRIATRAFLYRLF